MSIANSLSYLTKKKQNQIVRLVLEKMGRKKSSSYKREQVRRMVNQVINNDPKKYLDFSNVSYVIMRDKHEQILVDDVLEAFDEYSGSQRN